LGPKSESSEGDQCLSSVR